MVFFRPLSHPVIVLILVGLTQLTMNVSVRADKLTLKHGGAVRGALESSQQDQAPDSPVSLRTLSGALITVARDELTGVEERAQKFEEYEVLLLDIEKNVESHWKMAIWCKQNELPRQWLSHLNEILALEPDHLQALQTLPKAKTAVKKEEEREKMLARGFVPYKGKYVTPKERELLEQVDQQNEREKEWWKKVKLWHRWLAHSSASRQQNGVSAFRSIDSVDALPALKKYLLEGQSVEHRMLYAEVLANIADPQALVKLVELSLYDEHHRVREKAAENLPADQVDEVVTLYLQALKHPNHRVIRRAATYLGQLGDLRVVPYLIETLSSSHTYQVRVPVQNSYNVSVTRGNEGILGSPLLPPEVELGLRTGQYPYGVIINDMTQQNKSVQTQLVNVTRELQNAEVLAALKEITQEDFGFNKPRWRSWWKGVRNGKIKVSSGNPSNS